MSRASAAGLAISLCLSAALLAVFFVTAFAIHAAIARDAADVRLLQEARLQRAHLLRLQLDEETGIRGYAATGSRVFLQPYAAAKRAFAATAVVLHRSLVALGLNGHPLQEQLRLNQLWLDQVAGPILRDPRAGHGVGVELLGKAVIDKFRTQDDALSREMQGREAVFETNTGALVDRSLFYTLAIGVALAIVLGSLAIYQARLAAEAEHRRQSYERERQITEALQEALLPKRLPELPTLDFHAVYAPAGLQGRVGGDWYDAMPLDEGRVLFSIGDVAGHGLQAAVAMSRARQSIASVAMADRDPATILMHSNDVLVRQESSLVTAICGVVDANDRAFAYAGAGHPPMILRHGDGRTENLPSIGPPLGIADGIPYSGDVKTIEAGSMLVLYTDGVIEQTRNTERGELLLLDAVRSIDPGSTDPAADILSFVLGDVAPNDDVAILTLRFRSSAFVDR